MPTQCKNRYNSLILHKFTIFFGYNSCFFVQNNNYSHFYSYLCGRKIKLQYY